MAVTSLITWVRQQLAEVELERVILFFSFYPGRLTSKQESRTNPAILKPLFDIRIASWECKHFLPRGPGPEGLWTRTQSLLLDQGGCQGISLVFNPAAEGKD